MLLGPSSSRLFEANSVFVKQVHVTDTDRKGVVLYGFLQKPELSLEESWGVSNYMIVGSYRRKGFSLWLNKGSRVQIGLEAEKTSLNELEVSVIKGERKYDTLLPTNSIGADLFNYDGDKFSCSILLTKIFNQRTSSRWCLGEKYISFKICFFLIYL